MKTIGILGGIGPQATMELERQIHAIAQQRIPPRGNQGYPPLITVFMRHAPVRVDEQSRPIEPREPDPRMFEAARRLGEWADVIAIPSNTPHQFLDELRATAGSQILDMIRLTLDEVARRDVRPVGVLGLGTTHVYLEPLRTRGVPTVVPSEDEQDRLDRAIIRLMEGRAGEPERAAAARALASVREGGARATILGCSEIPLLLGGDTEADDLVDPVRLLAEAAVSAALDD